MTHLLWTSAAPSPPSPSSTETLSTDGALPYDIWLVVMSYLPPQDLCSLSLSSKRFNRLFNEKPLWKHLCTQRFQYEQFSIKELDNPLQTYKLCYLSYNLKKTNAELCMAKGDYQNKTVYIGCGEVRKYLEPSWHEANVSLADNELLLTYYYSEKHVITKAVNYHSHAIISSRTIDNKISCDHRYKNPIKKIHVQTLNIKGVSTLIHISSLQSPWILSLCNPSDLTSIFPSYSTHLYPDNALDIHETIESIAYFTMTDAPFLAVATSKGQIISFNLLSGREFLRYKPSEYCYVPSSSALQISYVEGKPYLIRGWSPLIVWNLAKNQCFAIKRSHSDENPLHSIFTAELSGRPHVLTGFSNGEVWAYDLQAKKNSHLFTCKGNVTQMATAHISSTSTDLVICLSKSFQLEMWEGNNTFHQAGCIKFNASSTYRSALHFGLFYKDNRPVIVTINADGSLTRYDFEQNSSSLWNRLIPITFQDFIRN
jgi:hypothetical protein